MQAKKKRTLIDGITDLQSDGGEWHTYSGKKQRAKQSNLVKGHKTLYTGRTDGKGGARCSWRLMIYCDGFVQISGRGEKIESKSLHGDCLASTVRSSCPLRDR